MQAIEEVPSWLRKQTAGSTTGSLSAKGFRRQQRKALRASGTVPPEFQNLLLLLLLPKPSPVELEWVRDEQGIHQPTHPGFPYKIGPNGKSKRFILYGWLDYDGEDRILFKGSLTACKEAAQTLANGGSI